MNPVIPVPDADCDPGDLRKPAGNSRPAPLGGLRPFVI